MSLKDVELVPYFDSKSKEIDITNDEARQFQGILSSIKYGWTQATTVDEICKLALTHSKVLEARRNALLGAKSPGHKPGQGGGYGVYDT